MTFVKCIYFYTYTFLKTLFQLMEHFCADCFASCYSTASHRRPAVAMHRTVLLRLAGDRQSPCIVLFYCVSQANSSRHASYCSIASHRRPAVDLFRHIHELNAVNLVTYNQAPYLVETNQLLHMIVTHLLPGCPPGIVTHLLTGCQRGSNPLLPLLACSHHPVLLLAANSETNKLGLQNC